MGLFISKHIVNCFHGTIEIESQEGSGTKCVVILPINNGKIKFTSNEFTSREELASISQSQIPSTEREEVKVSPSQIKVLVVDDNSMILQTMKCILSKLKCDVITATNGLQAVNTVLLENKHSSCSPIHFILMDANMPIMNGYEAGDQISALRNSKQIQPVSIACLSAQDSEAHRKRCYEAGMCEVLEKPCSVLKLKQFFAEHFPYQHILARMKDLAQMGFHQTNQTTLRQASSSKNIFQFGVLKINKKKFFNEEYSNDKH